MGVRRNEIVSAEKIIKSEFRSIDSILKRRKADPVINSIFKNVNIICQGQLRTAQRLLADKVGAEEIRIIEQLSHAILESIISVPMNNLRREIEIHNGREEELIRIVLKLFNYEKEISLSACSIKT
jgi:glutamyl-tRNA reductase